MNIKDCIFVGNDINDISIFKEVGCPIVIYPLENVKELTKSIKNIRYIKNFDELIRILKI